MIIVHELVGMNIEHVSGRFMLVWESDRRRMEHFGPFSDSRSLRPAQWLGFFLLDSNCMVILPVFTFVYSEFFSFVRAQNPESSYADAIFSMESQYEH